MHFQPRLLILFAMCTLIPKALVGPLATVMYSSGSRHSRSCVGAGGTPCVEDMQLHCNESLSVVMTVFTVPR